MPFSITNYSCSLLLALGLGSSRSQAGPSAPTLPHHTLQAAAEKAIPLVERSSAHSLGQRACFTCHHGANTVLAFNQGWLRGLSINEENFNQQLKRNYDRLAHNVPRFTDGRFDRGKGDLIGQSLWVLDAVGWQSDAVTAAAVHFLLDHDAHLDHWESTDVRPPTVGSPFTTTYVVLRGLKRYGSIEHHEKFEQRTTAALAWLQATKSIDTEDMVSRLRLLHLLEPGSEAFLIEKKKLIDIQREDGGWAQTDYLGSDAYATGTALAALNDTTAIPPTDPVYQDGLRYLIATQEDDGSWHVRKRTRTFQPFFESSFPHQRDQFISIAATSWSIYAILQALPMDETAPTRSYIALHPEAMADKGDAPLSHSPEALAFFTSKIQPVLEQRCYKCHSATSENLKAKLYLDTPEGMLTGGENGPAIVPGAPDQSLIIKSLLEKDDLSLMPPKKGLPPGIIADFQTWILMGAADTRTTPPRSNKVLYPDK